MHGFSSIRELPMVGETTSLKYPVEALPLAGVRVLDFTGSLGVYCGKLLADIGGDVIKVELPRGDDLRSSHPFGTVPHRGPTDFSSPTTTTTSGGSHLIGLAKKRSRCLRSYRPSRTSC